MNYSLQFEEIDSIYLFEEHTLKMEVI